MCVGGIVSKPAPTQESERSCICVLGVSLPSLHQPRKVSGHVYVCWGYRYQACTKPGKWVVMYMCVGGIATQPAPSQESEWSCICVLGVSNQESEWSCICALGVSLPSLCQARKVSGHIYVCWGYLARKVSGHV